MIVRQFYDFQYFSDFTISTIPSDDLQHNYVLGIFLKVVLRFKVKCASNAVSVQ